MRKEIDNIVIQEPPLQELSKKKSCFKRSCLTGCGCIIIFLIASLAILKFATGPRSKELKNIPDNFPVSIPVYDKDNINKITFISGKERSQGIEIVAFVPKLILSPIILALDKILPMKKTDNGANAQIKKNTSWEDFIHFMKKPISNRRDIIQIEWAALGAEPKFISEYYQTELEKNEYKISNNSVTDEIHQFSFQKEEIEGVIYIEDKTPESGTDYFSLTVNSPID